MTGEDLILSEVMARVSFWLVVFDYRKNNSDYDNPNTGMIRCANRVTQGGFWTMGFWIVSAAFDTRKNKRTLAQWRDVVIRRARQHRAMRNYGHPWRRCPNPPVSNTGVRAYHRVERGPLAPRRTRWPDGKR
jgi:hypothetical protein